MLVSQYNHILVVLSFVVAILAAYTALNMAARVAGSEGVAARVWLAGGGIAMGIGVWAMHFIGMLAMDLSMSMSYNASLTVLSMVIAVGSSLFALWLVSCEQLRLRRLLPGALVMGSGIVAMHYTGMAAGSDARDYLGQDVGGHFGRDCACRFARGIMAHLPPASRSRAGRADAHGCRHHDGNCHCRHALCRDESGSVSDVHNGSP
jgi:hypothetical protein